MQGECNACRGRRGSGIPGLLLASFWTTRNFNHCAAQVHGAPQEGDCKGGADHEERKCPAQRACMRMSGTTVHSALTCAYTAFPARECKRVHTHTHSHTQMHTHAYVRGHAVPASPETLLADAPGPCSACVTTLPCTCPDPFMPQPCMLQVAGWVPGEPTTKHRWLPPAETFHARPLL